MSKQSMQQNEASNSLKLCHVPLPVVPGNSSPLHGPSILGPLYAKSRPMYPYIKGRGPLKQPK